MKLTRVTDLIQQNPRRTGLLILGVGFLIFVVPGLFSRDVETVVEDALPPLVSLTSASEYSQTGTLSLIGTVRALSEAEITAEQGGQVVSVPVTLGASVRAGQVIAVLENASERAAVLQAEGAYEAALAASAQSSIGVNEALTSLRTTESAVRSTLLSSYTTVNATVLNTIDDFFANPQSRLPGLRIDGKGATAALNAERVAYQTLLREWQTRTESLNDADLDEEIIYARENVARTIRFIEDFITVFSVQGNSNEYTDAQLATFRSEFASVKSTLIATDTALSGASANLSAARDTLLRAETAATGGTVSAADAQVKQALGVLRAAQANLAKTILTTPVSGTINSLSVKTGGYITGGSQVAVVANNTAFEIVTFVSDTERSIIAVGDELIADDTATATVRAIAPAIDPETRKFEVRLVNDDGKISNGDTVKLRTATTSSATDAEIRIPITAVKFEVENGFVFGVENGALIKRPVTIGQITGNTVVIESGLLPSDQFVIDARGLQAGDAVTIGN
jgi:RND family efflux transporter MFP subunit